MTFRESQKSRKQDVAEKHVPRPDSSKFHFYFDSKNDELKNFPNFSCKKIKERLKSNSTHLTADTRPICCKASCDEVG